MAMRIKLDENMPTRLAEVLRKLGHDADTARDEGLSGRPDPEIWRAAQAEGRFLITQDLDLSDARIFSPGTHHGILIIRIPNATRSELIDRVRAIFTDEDVESWRRGCVVASATKIRSQKAPQIEGNGAS